MKRISLAKARFWLICAVCVFAIGTLGCCDCGENCCNCENSGSESGDGPLEIAEIDHIYAISTTCIKDCSASARIVDPDGTFEVARGDVVLFVNFTDDVRLVTLKYSSTLSETFTMPMNSTRRVTIIQDVAEPGPEIYVVHQVVGGPPPHGGPGMRVRP